SRQCHDRDASDRDQQEGRDDREPDRVLRVPDHPRPDRRPRFRPRPDLLRARRGRGRCGARRRRAHGLTIRPRAQPGRGWRSTIGRPATATLTPGPTVTDTSAGVVAAGGLGPGAGAVVVGPGAGGAPGVPGAPDAVRASDTTVAAASEAGAVTGAAGAGRLLPGVAAGGAAPTVVDTAGGVPGRTGSAVRSGLAWPM